MRRFLATLVAFLALLTIALAQIPMTGAGKGTPAPPAAYTGPGDKVAGASYWVGLRAYSAATRGANAINLCNISNTCADVATDAVTGDLTAPTNIGGVDCTAVTTCTINTWYDQTAGGNCAGSCDHVQTVLADRFTFTWNCQNGHPCAKQTGITTALPPGQTAGNFSSATPYTVTGVAERTGAITTQGCISRVFGAYMCFTSSVNTAGIFAGTFLTATANDSAPHAFLGIYTTAGTGCTFDVDGIGSASGTCGNTFASSPSAVGSDVASNDITGNFMEFGSWPISMTGGAGGQQDLIISNEKTYWGF